MRLEILAKKLDRVVTADAYVADTYLRHVANKAAVGLLGALLAAIGMGMLGMSLFWLLERYLGAVPAAALVGAAICGAGAVLLLMVTRLRPPRELESAMDVRHIVRLALEEEFTREAADSLRSDAHALNPALEALLSSAFSQLIALLIHTLRSREPKERLTSSQGASGGPEQVGKATMVPGGTA